MPSVALRPATLTLTVCRAISDKKEEPEKASSGDNSPKQDDQQHETETEADPKSKGKGKSKEETAVEPHGREGSTPSNILEKGMERAPSVIRPDKYPGARHP